jgi:hypothetical protein
MKQLKYIKLFEEAAKGSAQPLQFIKSPAQDKGVVPFGSDVKYGLVKVIYNFALGELTFRSTRKIDGINKAKDGYEIFSEPGELTLTALKDGEQVAVLTTRLDPKGYQEYVLAQGGNIKTITLTQQPRPAGDFAIAASKGLIIVRSATDNLEFDSSSERLEGVVYKGGFYYIPISIGSSSISTTTKDHSAVVLNQLNFGMPFADETEPKIAQGDVYYYVAQ